MGLEACCEGSWHGGSGPLDVLLESEVLIVRGALRRRIARADWARPRVVDARLIVGEGDAALELALGAARAARWAARMTAPPPSLAAKLGISAVAPARVLGAIADAVLASALDGATTTADGAASLVATVSEPDDLHAALAAACPGQPIWIVHRKGRDAAFGEAPIRAAMRAAGWIDSKSCAVSPAWSATRYGRRLG